MLQDLPTLDDEITTAFDRLLGWLGATFDWSDLWQIAAIAAAAAVAELLRWRLAGPMRDWTRRRERPMWQLRLLVPLGSRLWLLAFVALSWALVWGAGLAGVSRYLLQLAAALSLAWIAVVVAARAITNPVLRTMVRWSLWAYVTLWMLGLLDAAWRTLDRAALSIGDTRLSALDVLKALLAVALLLSLARVLAHLAAAHIRDNAEMSPSFRVLSVKVMQVAFYGVAFVAGLWLVGVDLTGLAVLSGAIGVGLGFGLQKVVSNLISGIIILLDKSIKPGDVISIGETFGWVSTLGARYTSITTRDGKAFLIPNEDMITGQVVNWSHADDYVRLDVTFGTAYDCDPHLVRRISVQAAKGVDRVLAEKAPACHIERFGPSSVDYILWFWIRDPSSGLVNVRGEVYLALWDAFQEHGVSIPFPQHEVRMLDGVRLERD